MKAIIPCAAAFLNSLIVFPPDDTASALDPGDRSAAAFPQMMHGSIRLTALFNNPLIVEYGWFRVPGADGRTWAA